MKKSITSIIMIVVFCISCGTTEKKKEDLTMMPKPDVLNRLVWEAAMPQNPIKNQKPSWITIYEDRSPKIYQTTPELYLKELQDETIGKYGDIGSHFYIDKVGNIYEGRNILTVGVSPHKNIKAKGHIFICFLGDFNEKLSIEQRTIIKGKLHQLILWLLSENHIQPDCITGLRDFCNEDNPSDFIYYSFKNKVSMEEFQKVYEASFQRKNTLEYMKNKY